MDYFPIFTQLKNKKCLLVGGGEVASRKLELLIQAETSITVIATCVSTYIQDKAKTYEGLHIIEGEYHSSNLDGIDLVIAATDSRSVNEAIHRDATERHLFVNVVDNPDLCTFITPAIVDRGPITIAIGTGGTAPVLARLLRGKIESLIPSTYGKLASLAAAYRVKVKATLPTGTASKNFWEEVFEGEISEKVFSGDQQGAERQLEVLLQNHQQIGEAKGEVYLVGAGPGDPDLLSFRALRLMQKADVVVYDRLVSDSVLNLVRRDAERIYVGEQMAKHCVPQDKINDLLVKLAKDGKRVLRLKGGDPYIFGRGGEEAECLVEQGVEFQVVPGITSAVGASTYCGIPLTHRDYAQSVTFVTGHLKNNEVNLDWPALAKPRQTLVIYMGIAGLGIIARNLVEHGLMPATLVAVIHNATRPDQCVVISDLQNIEAEVARAQLQSPALIIVGDVVKLHETLNAQ